MIFAFQNLPDAELSGSKGMSGYIPPESTLDSRPYKSRMRLAKDLVAEPVYRYRDFAKFDLTVYLTETEQGSDITWQYNADLFDDDRAAG